MIGERLGALASLPASCGLLSHGPDIRAPVLSFPEKIENYITVELRRPLEACAMVWPESEPESIPQTANRAGWKRMFAGGLFSLFTHVSLVALAFAMLPVSEELPSGSETVISLEVMDEAAFAALQEGTTKGEELPDVTISVPDPAEPFDARQAFTFKEIVAIVPGPEPDLPMPEEAAPLDLALLAPIRNEPERKRPIAAEKGIRKNESVKKVRKPAPAKGSPTAVKAPGKRGGGSDTASTASATLGRTSRNEGLGGTAANTNLRAGIIAHIGRHKRYPKIAEPLRLEGSVGVTFSIGGDGSLKNASIRASSGHKVLDNDALAMLRRAQPYPVSTSGGQGITITTQIGYVYPRR